VSFQRYGRLYYLDPGPFSPRVGEKVLVPTGDGPEVAECVWPPQPAAEEIGGLPTVAGLADDADLARDAYHRRRRAQARRVVREAVRAHGLPMKLVGVDYVETAALRRFTVYFTAPGRVDFRALVRELARSLSARVELRQLSARDEARVQGGIGSCGRDLCCATHLADFEPVSLRMAKDQELPTNPLRISGACGRLLCCLRYEHPLYQRFRAKVPAVGVPVDTPAGAGRVVAHNVPADSVTVRLAETGRRCVCAKATVTLARAVRDAPGPTGVADLS
jgi:cell fate regulator YaaT (PSP1 superfamily)